MEPSLLVGLGWFVVIGFMFFAQHHVCDAYFVPAINVFVEKMRKSKTKCLQRWGEEAVAGATICALGCNGPELFTNLISLYTGSDAGIGVVVGSEIFNLLIIVGCAVLAAPSLPLQIERVPFARDVIFYGLSIALLYWSLLDKAISWHEATTLLGAAAVYVITVYFTTDVVNCLGLGGPEKKDVEVAGAAKQKGRMHGIDVEVEEIVHSRMADGKNAGHSAKWNLDATAHGIYAEPLDAAGPAEKTDTKRRGSIGFQFQSPDAMLGSVLKYKDLKEVVVMEMGVIELEFYFNFQHVTLKLTTGDGETRDQLLKNIEEFSLGRPWVHKYDASIFGAIAHLTHTLKSKDETIFSKFCAFPEFIIDFLLKGTLFAVDVKDIKKEGRWPLCFAGAMFWLAVFSFCMLEIAEEIHYNIPVLPNSFLGITVCAIGTSFPNAVASILMAQQNKPAAAIANALGSNVQNVFLAMALPWVIYSCQTDFQPIKQNVAGINEGVFWMAATLLLVVVFVILPGFCTLSRTNGIVLIILYVFYLILTSGETFNWWPPLMN
jgi:Ca2+/Na+ antiporter